MRLASPCGLIIRARMIATKYKNTRTALPDNLSAAHVRIRELESLLKVAELGRTKAELKAADLLQRLYGAKSEKLSDEQRALFGIMPAAPPAPIRITQTAPVVKTNRRGGGRHLNTDHLPVVRRVLDVPEEERVGLVKIREEVTKQLECQARRYYMLHTVRPVWASPTRAHPPIVAPLPPQVLPQASVGASFITHIVVSKYVDHVPLHRQESIDARAGVWVPRQARARYVKWRPTC
jgi:transposase